MRKKAYILIIVNVLFISFFGLHAQTVTLDTNRMRIGEHNALHFSVEASKFNLSKMVWPSISDVLTNNKFEIIEIGKQDTVFDGNKKISALQQKIVFSVFDSGFYVIPSFGIALIDTQEDDFVAFTDSLMLEVLTIPVDTNVAFKDIKGPMEEPVRFSEILPYILGGLLFVVVLSLAFYFYNRFKKKKPLFKLMEKERLKPHDWAVTELHKIKNKKIWQNGFVKDYYVELTDVVRRYFEEEFSFGAMEMTTSELLSKLRELNFNRDVLDSLLFVLSNADLAKFAKSQPLDVDNEKCMNLSIEIVVKSHDFYLKKQSADSAEKGGVEE